MTVYNDSYLKVGEASIYAGYQAGASANDDAKYLQAGGGYSNVGIGAQALEKNVRGWRNTVVGFQAMKDNVEGQNNVAVGDSALEFNVGTTAGSDVADSSKDPGSRNTALGSYALRYNTIGIGNVGVGRDAGHANQSGNFNTAVGTYAYSGTVTEGGAQDRKSASYNTAVGYNALFNTDEDDNIGVGQHAAYNNITGKHNIAIGSNANRTAIESNRNVVVGNSALRVLEQGSDNVAIGSEALRNVTYGVSNTALGDLALAYDVAGAKLTSVNNSIGLGKQSRVTGDKQLQLGTSGITSYSYGAVQQRSDARDKADIKDSELGLEFISKLRPVDFKWDYREDYSVINEEDGSITINEKDGSKKRERFHHGFIAQEVRNVIEETGVDFGGFQDHSLNGGNDVLSLGHEEFIAPLVKAVQELSARVVELEAKAAA